MKQVLLDTNVVLDVLLNRSPWATQSQLVWQAHDDGLLIGYLCATSLTNIFYVARRLTNLEMAHSAIETCLATFEITPVDQKSLKLALSLPGKDFEDNLQIACAKLADLDAVVTRNPNDFQFAELPVVSPADISTWLSQ